MTTPNKPVPIVPIQTLVERATYCRQFLVAQGFLDATDSDRVSGRIRKWIRRWSAETQKIANASLKNAK